nr:uncharacterized protein LOC117841613 [Setaria viridis]
MEQEDRTSECDTGGNSEQMVSDTWAHEQDTLGTINANDETDNQGHGTPNEKDAIPTDENDSRPTERSVASPLHAEVHGNDSSIPAANIEHHKRLFVSQPAVNLMNSKSRTSHLRSTQTHLTRTYVDKEPIQMM